MSSIQYFSEDINYHFPEPSRFNKFLISLLLEEGYSIQTLNYIFCSDGHLLSINQKFLEHDYFTDVITFDYAESPNLILGDIFISIDRVQENASTFNLPFLVELHRVMIHGVLHLIGFDDSTPNLRLQMHKLENYYLLKFVK